MMVPKRIVLQFSSNAYRIIMDAVHSRLVREKLHFRLHELARRLHHGLCVQ